MKKFFGKLSIDLKIFGVMALILLLSISITGSFVQRRTRMIYMESLDRAIQLIVQENSSVVVDYIQRATALDDTLSTEIDSFFPAIEQEEDVFGQYRIFLDLQAKMDSFCNAIMGNTPACRCYLLLRSDFPMSRLFYAPEAKLFYEDRRDGTSFYIYSDENVQQEEWFLEAATSDRGISWFMAPDSRQLILAACDVSDMFMVNGSAKQYTLGTLVIKIDLSQVIENGENDDFFSEMDIWVSDASIREEQDSAWRMWEQVLPNGMYLHIQLPRQAYDAQVRVNLQTILISFAIVLGAGIAFAALFTTIITKPIRRLSAHMKNSAVPTVIDNHYTTEDEIGILYRTYNEMAEKNEAQIQQIYEYSEHQKKLTYQMLQAQIHPHFLYNTLDSVGCAALLNGDEKLSDVLTRLSSLLRYNLNRPECLVTLGEELKMLDEYIAIQQFRCDDRILMAYEIAPEIKETKMPKTILQPLVENSIFYGAVNAKGYWEIRIEAQTLTESEDRNKVVIRVCNGHNNISNTLEETVEQLNDYLDGKCELKRKSSGLGILNVQQRIAIAFGEEYGIRYEKRNDSLAAVVSLPFFC